MCGNKNRVVMFTPQEDFMLAKIIRKLELPQEVFCRDGSMVLTEISQWTDFNDKSKVLGSRVAVALPKLNYEKIIVNVGKVLTIDQAQIDTSPPIMVEFTDFVGKIWEKDGNSGVKATASSMKVVKAQQSPPAPAPKAKT